MELTVVSQRGYPSYNVNIEDNANLSVIFSIEEKHSNKGYKRMCLYLVIYEQILCRI